MEDRLKSDPPASPKPDELSDGWTGTRPNSKRSRSAKETPPASPPELSDLEKQVNAGWDAPES